MRSICCLKRFGIVVASPWLVPQAQTLPSNLPTKEDLRRTTICSCRSRQSAEMAHRRSA